MKIKIFFLLTLISFAIICCESKTNEKKFQENKIKIIKLEPQEKLETYILHPNPKDKQCLSDIKRAENDINNGKIIFSMPTGEGDFNLRQEKYIKKLCNKYNIFFKFEDIGCTSIENNRRGCYIAYMDNKLIEKFGKSFKQNLLDDADDLLLKSNDTVLCWDCDKKPIIVGVTEHEDSINVQLDKLLKEELNKNKINFYPGIDISLYIDKNGKASGYHLEEGSNLRTLKNKKLKQKLINSGIEELKKHKICIPGKIKNQTVNTKYIIRVYFS